MVYALIKDGVVFNTIVADQAFIDTHKDFLGYDLAMPFEESSFYPGPGFTYDGVNFTPPAPPEQEDDGNDG